MEKLFNSLYFSVKKINDKDIDDVIVKLYKEMAFSRNKIFIGYRIASQFESHSAVALDIFYKICGENADV